MIQNPDPSLVVEHIHESGASTCFPIIAWGDDGYPLYLDDDRLVSLASSIDDKVVSRLSYDSSGRPDDTEAPVVYLSAGRALR